MNIFLTFLYMCKHVVFAPLSCIVLFLSIFWYSNEFDLQQSATDVTNSTGGRVRRDSGCYLSNENINNNSSNSSTCEKKEGEDKSATLTPDTGSSGSQANKAPAVSPNMDIVVDKLKRQMASEGIDLTAQPYTDEVGVLRTTLLYYYPSELLLDHRLATQYL